jgi:hypothetical protein
LEKNKNKYDLKILIVKGKRITWLGDMWNECWRASKGDILQLAGDDITYETKEWDRIVRKRFDGSEDKILLVYGGDGKRDKITHPWIHRRWTDILGYFTPTELVYGNDSWLEEIAFMLGRITFEKKILISHQPLLDEVRLEMKILRSVHKNSGKFWKRGPERIEDAKKLRKYMIGGSVDFGRTLKPGHRK